MASKTTDEKIAAYLKAIATIREMKASPDYALVKKTLKDEARNQWKARRQMGFDLFRKAEEAGKLEEVKKMLGM